MEDIMTIAIIGTGVAGMSVLKYLIKQKINEDILLFDDQKYLSKGRAFQYDHPDLLMNYPGNQLSMKLNKPDDFEKWVDTQSQIDEEKHQNEHENKTGNVYYSRQLFGKYMQSHFEKYVQNKKVQVITNHVRNMIQIDNRYEIQTQEESYQVDTVFLATGQFGTSDHYQLKDIEAFRLWPYPLHQLEVEQNKQYAVLGTGLSAVDCARYILPKTNQPLLLFSRKGQVQSVRGKMAKIQFKYLTIKNIHKNKENGFIPLNKVVELFLKEAKHHKIDIETLLNVKRNDPVKAMKFDLSHPETVGYLQSFILKLTQQASLIWPYFTIEDKDDYLQNYHQLLQNYANPMPEDTATELLNAVQNKQLQIIPNMQDVKYLYKKFRITTSNEEYRTHYLINATGPSKTFAQAIEPNQLIKNLYNQGLLIEHPYGGFYVTPETNQVITSKGIAPNFYMLGQKTGGVNFLNNGIVELIQEAKRVVKDYTK